MILINLLPHREARRLERKRSFFAALGLAALIGVGIVLIWFAVLQALTQAQSSRNDYLSAEIKKLDAKIKDIADLKAEIEALKARQTAVENLQGDRNVPVYLLNELVKQTPEGVYITSLRQTGNLVVLAGVAQSNERVSEMLRNTANESPWLEKPELIEIKAAKAAPGRDQRKLLDFSLRVSIKRPAAAAEAASGAAGKGKAAKRAPAGS